jgi:hypothetical protein
MTTNKRLFFIALILVISAVVLTACGGGQEQSEYEMMMGGLASECMSNGQVGPACDLYYAYEAVEAANADLEKSLAAYNAAHAPTPAPTNLPVDASATPGP